MSAERGAVIEIVERRKRPAEDSLAASIVVPNEVRINGQKLMLPADEPIQIHEITKDGLVQVTLTLIARRIFVGHEDLDESLTDEVSAAEAGLAQARRDIADAQTQAHAALRQAMERVRSAHSRVAEATSE